MFGISIALSEFTANTVVPCRVTQGNSVLCWLSSVLSSSGGSHGLPEFVQSGNENSFPFRHVHSNCLGRKGKRRVKLYLLHTQNRPPCEFLRIALMWGPETSGQVSLRASQEDTRLSLEDFSGAPESSRFPVFLFPPPFPLSVPPFLFFFSPLCLRE